jgi:hypothetical protein
MRRIDVFLYDLFMDENLLRARGVAPANPLAASVSGVRLRIGKRAAALVPDHTGRVFGLVASLTHSELEKLYPEPGEWIYRPEAVLTHLSNGEFLAALCFNLVEPPLIDERDPECASKLRSLAERLHFPAEYVASIV